MNIKSLKIRAAFLIVITLLTVQESSAQLKSYNPVWTSQSKNSLESMPLGGGDIGLNVWCENDQVYFYIARSGTFDENNSLLKLGRIKLSLSPNPFSNSSSFRQELHLNEGYISISTVKNGQATEVKLWVDVFNPAVHVEVKSQQALSAQASYESWRYTDRVPKGKENNQNSYKWAPQGEVKTWKDQVSFQKNEVEFYHQNRQNTVFDVTVKQQRLDSVKRQLFNPLENLVFGGRLVADNFEAADTSSGTYINTPFKSWILKSKVPSRNHQLHLVLHRQHTPDLNEWKRNLNLAVFKALKQQNQSQKKTIQWWNDYWKRSYININSTKADPNAIAWQVGRNYQLMRYMLGCNLSGSYPTKFNGGLFTADPSLTDTTLNFTPDFRNWGGGTHTAQNQRLVYWPMLKSGDFDLMKPQFNFYLNLLKNAEIRSKVYWKHNGASFTEQLENFGLPNPAEYNWKRPASFDPGLEYNAWLEYEWDTVLEFCLMMLEMHRYNGSDIKNYIPFIESCLTFFNEHYQYRAKNRGNKALDGEGHLVIYPGSGAETYKMAYNPSSTISGLRTVLTRLLELPMAYLTTEKRQEWELMLKRIPGLSFREFDGHPTISPAKVWERVNNTESPQLYPVFPWGTYGIGKPGLDTAINTFKYDKDVLKFRSHVGWKQDNIFAARLGLTEEAWNLTSQKLKDSGRRFPAFWGPGFDWVPDHNWGGSGMIGLQEMLLQADGEKIYLLPTWPKEHNVHFKLNAPYQTTVEASWKDGKLEFLKVLPAERKKDIILPIK